MKRVYTLPYGVVPILPQRLVPYVTLGEVGADGLVHSFSVDRCSERDTPETDRAVSWVGVSTWFPEEQVCVAIRIHIHWRHEAIFQDREGAWSVQRRCVIIDRNVIP